MIIYHGTHEIVQTPEIRITRFYKDFGYGFYCTALFEQAKRWAVRYPGDAYVCEYKYSKNPDLNILTFSEMTEDWLDFIIACRAGNSHDYDIVEGPMANDTVYNYVQDYIDKKITRAAFWELARFKKPTHQISFNTEKALHTLKFIREVQVIDEE